MAITFPAEPEIGQEFVGDNAVTYQWTGDRWSTAVPALAGRSSYIAVGGFADTEYNDDLDNTIDGGNGAQ